jgi:hypothetical protein
MGNCSFEVSCMCNICLRQPPSLRRLASQAVFHVRYNIDQFELTAETLYDNYKFAADSKKVSFSKLVPVTFPTLHCNLPKLKLLSAMKTFTSLTVFLIKSFTANKIYLRGVCSVFELELLPEMPVTKGSCGIHVLSSVLFLWPDCIQCSIKAFYQETVEQARVS